MLRFFSRKQAKWPEKGSGSGILCVTVPMASLHPMLSKVPQRFGTHRAIMEISTIPGSYPYSSFLRNLLVFKLFPSSLSGFTELRRVLINAIPKHGISWAIKCKLCEGIFLCFLKKFYPKKTANFWNFGIQFAVHGFPIATEIRKSGSVPGCRAWYLTTIESNWTPKINDRVGIVTRESFGPVFDLLLHLLRETGSARR